MPFIFSERLPVPTVKSYCLISLIIFAASLLYAQSIISESDGENARFKTMKEQYERALAQHDVAKTEYVNIYGPGDVPSLEDCP